MQDPAHITLTPEQWSRIISLAELGACSTRDSMDQWKDDIDLLSALQTQLKENQVI